MQQLAIWLFGILAFLLKVFPCQAQDYTWWNTKHNWDGRTHWNKYLTISPAYLGPNALPVPEINSGETPDQAEFTVAFEGHLSKGDKTQNLYTRLYIPLFSNRAGVNVAYIPVEHYVMDTLTRDARGARDQDGRGFAVGDVYLGTFIQVLANRTNLPDILVSFHLKTTSGTKLSAARHTDTHAFWIDMSVGKTFETGRQVLQTVRPYIQVGFFTWQTYRDNLRQNDSVVYGAGTDLGFEGVDVSNAIGGYAGYIGDGDKPVVYRLSMTTKRKKLVNYTLRFQQGLHDFRYTSFRIGCSLNLDHIVNRMNKRANVANGHYY